MASEPTDRTEAKRLGQALAVLRARAGISQAAAGETIGISGEGWRKYEAGAPGIFRPDIQRRLTAALGASPEDLAAELRRDQLGTEPLELILRGKDHSRIIQLRVPGTLPILDVAQAGAWREADDARQDEPARYPAARDMRFPNAEQWLAEVRGDSMDAVGIFDGDLIHCVGMSSGYSPKTGDIVEVERTRFQGSMREIAVKQVEVREDGSVLLWPRSSNPRWSEALALGDGSGTDEDVEVRVRALVVGSIRRFA